MTLLAGARVCPRTEVRVLGPVVAIRDGEPVTLGGPRQRCVLAVLVAHGPVVVSRDSIVDQVWAERAPDSAANAVQVYVSQLRSALGRDAIVTEGAGYRLALTRDAVDTWRFADLLARGASELSMGHIDVASTLFTEGLQEWRGDPFQGLDDIEILRVESDRLQELRAVADEGRLEAALAQGRHAQALPELRELVRRHPLRERGWGLLMRAQYAAGRQADALETYARARDVLVEELGIDPGPELRRLEEAVLRQDPALGAGDPLLPPLPESLSAPGPTFVGRERELAWLAAGLDRISKGGSLTLVLEGGPGIGKTRLVAEFARLAQSRRIPVSYAVGAACLAAPAPAEGIWVRVFDGVETIPAAAAPELATRLEHPHPCSLDIYCLTGAITALPIRVAMSRLAAEEGTERVLGPLGDQEVEQVARIYDPTADEQEVRSFASGVGSLSPREAHEAASAWAIGRASGRVRAAAAVLPQARDARDRLLSSLVDAQQALARRRTNLAGLASVQPYVGLTAYDETNASIFFGRERLVAQLLERLMTSRLVVVAGASGTGKSSAVRAGVVPAVAAGSVPGGEHWQCIVTTPTRLTSDALQAQLLADEPRTDRLLVLDQLEEAFTSLTAEGRNELGGLLGGALANERTRVVATLRSDFLDQAASWPALQGRLVEPVVLVGPMSEEDLRRVIEQPAVLVGVRFESGLPERILRDAGSEPGSLPLLSTVLLALWDRREGTKLTHAAYDASGGLHGAINLLAEETYARLDVDEAAVARRILLRLADLDADQTFVRRRRPIEQVADPGDVVGLRVLHHLVSHRLLVADRGAVEVAHEALLTRWSRLRSCLEGDADARRARDQIVQATHVWREGGRLASDVVRGQRLVAAQEFAAEHADELTDDEREFLAVSQAQADQERARQRKSVRRLRVLAAALSVLVLLAGLSAWTAIDQRERADDQRRTAAANAVRADARRMAVQATQEVRPDLALLLAAHAVQLDENPDTRNALLSVLNGTELFAGRMFSGDSPVERVVPSPRGDFVALRALDGDVTVLEAATRRTVTEVDASALHCLELQSCLSMAFSPDGKLLAVPGSEGLHVLNLARSGAPVARVLPVTTNEFASVEFVGNGSLAYIEGRVWDLETGRRLPRPSGSKRGPHVSELSRLADGRLVLQDFRSADVLDVDGMRFRRFFGRLQGDETIRTAERDERGRLLGMSEQSGPFMVSQVSPDGRFIAKGAKDGRVALWSRRTRLRIAVTPAHHGAVTAVRWSPDSRSVATAGLDGRALVWSVPGLTRPQELRGHSDSVRDVAFSDEGRSIYTAGRDGTVLRWDLDGAGSLAQPFVETPNLGPDQLMLVTTARVQPGPHGAVAASFTFVDVSSLSPELRTQTFVWSSGLPRRDIILLCPAWVDRCRHPVELEPDMRVFESPAEGTLLVRAPGPPGGGERWFSLAADGDTRSLVAHDPVNLPAAAVAESADGRRVLIDSGDGQVTVWDKGTGQPTGPPVTMDDEMVAFGPLSPDGTLLAAFSWATGKVAVFDVSNGRRVSPELESGSSGFAWLRFSPDGRLFAVLTDGRLEFRSTTTWEPVSLPIPEDLGQADQVHFSPSGRVLLTTGVGGVYVWDLTAQEPTSTRIPVEGGAGYEAVFLSDDRVLTMDPDNADYRSWYLDSGSWVALACSRAGRDLTGAEWADAAPGLDDIPAC